VLFRSYASFLRTSGALHLGIFDQPEEIQFFRKLLGPYLTSW
jgi:hypothetical protein